MARIKQAFLLIAISICAAVIGLNNFAPGFCIMQLRHLTPDQAMDNYLFGSWGDKLSLEKKIIEAKQRGIDYSKCCTITSHYPSEKDNKYSSNQKYYFFLTIYQKRSPRRQSPSHVYDQISIWLNRCGWAIAKGGTSLSIEQMEKINADKSRL